MILDLLTANPAGLTLAQLREAAGADIASLGALVSDGRVEPCDLGGVDGYRLAAPKAAQPERKRRTGLSLAETDALRQALGLTVDADGTVMLMRARGRIAELDAALAAGMRFEGTSTDGTLVALLPYDRALDNEIKDVLVAEAYPWLPDADDMSPVVGTLRQTLRHLVGEAETCRAMSSAAALTPTQAPTLPAGWSAYYVCGKARVCGQGDGWAWTVDEAGPNGSGGLATDLSMAFARADAVRALS